MFTSSAEIAAYYDVIQDGNHRSLDFARFLVPQVVSFDESGPDARQFGWQQMHETVDTAVSVFDELVHDYAPTLAEIIQIRRDRPAYRRHTDPFPLKCKPIGIAEYAAGEHLYVQPSYADVTQRDLSFLLARTSRTPRLLQTIRLLSLPAEERPLKSNQTIESRISSYQLFYADTQRFLGVLGVVRTIGYDLPGNRMYLPGASSASA